MTEFSAQPVARDLIIALTVAFEAWLNKNYQREDGGLAMSGKDVDFILNGLVNFTSSRIATIYKELLKLGAAEQVGEDVLKKEMVELTTNHFRKSLIINIEG